MGAPGTLNVPYLKCCEGACEGEHPDWGKMCVTKNDSK